MRTISPVFVHLLGYLKLALLNVNVKGKGHHITGHEGPRGGVEV
jgi:hypothetical protein